MTLIFSVFCLKIFFVIFLFLQMCLDCFYCSFRINNFLCISVFQICFVRCIYEVEIKCFLITFMTFRNLIKFHSHESPILDEFARREKVGKILKSSLFECSVWRKAELKQNGIVSKHFVVYRFRASEILIEILGWKRVFFLPQLAAA